MSKKDELQLFNFVVMYDLYIVAHSKEEARNAILASVRQGEEPTDITEYTIRATRDIRNEWKHERPLVAGAITDTEWEPFKGMKTQEFFEAVTKPTS